MVSYYAVVPKAISDEDIERIKKIISSKELSKGSLKGDRRLDLKRRNSEIYFFSPDEDLWLYTIIGSIASSANKFFNFDISSVEDVQYTEYKDEYKGFYDWHIDSYLDADNPLSDRKLAVSLQLSDLGEYEGCNLELKIQGFDKKEVREKGTAIVFPSFLEHRVTSVTTGTRKCLVSWIQGAKFR